MSKKSGSGISLNKISFWLLVSAAILYVVGIVLSAVARLTGGTGILRSVTSYLQAVAAALMVCVVAVLAWRHVANKPAIWKVLYFIVLLIVLAGLVIPAIL